MLKVSWTETRRLSFGSELGVGNDMTSGLHSRIHLFTQADINASSSYLPIRALTASVIRFSCSFFVNVQLDELALTGLYWTLGAEGASSEMGDG